MSLDASDVAIVGAGPVGLALANFLGLYGVETVVIESLPSLIDYPRGVGMDDECLRSFQTLGLVDEVLPHTTPNQLLRFVNGKGRCFASIEPRTKDFGWPRRSAFIQPLVDQVLLEGLDRFEPCRVRWGTTVSGYSDDSDGVTVFMDGPSGPSRLRCRYLVGCDGGRSVVRKQMGVTWDGTSSPTRWLVVDVRNDPLGTPNAYVHADPRRPYVSIALPHNTRRFEFMLLSGEDEDTMAGTDRVDNLIASVFPGLGSLDYIRRRVYTHHARIAGSFVKGRVMVAGDAAHLMPVWQGQGYNSGIRDATNLGWKLACVVKGLGRSELIDTYDAERRAHAAAMIKISQMAGLLVRQTRRSTALFRDVLTRAWDVMPPLKRYIVEMRYKPMPRYTSGIVVQGSGDAAGRMFIQPSVVTREGNSMLLDDVLGPWFAMVAWSGNPRAHLDEDARQVWKSLGDRFITVRPMTQLHWPEPGDDDLTVVGDATGAVKNWFDAHEGSSVMLRPDRFVACLARPADTSEKTRRLAALLGLGASVDGP
jgi:3-(3-hydroxy-phenyl)propionate hydroxylase